MISIACLILGSLDVIVSVIHRILISIARLDLGIIERGSVGHRHRDWLLGHLIWDSDTDSVEIKFVR